MVHPLTLDLTGRDFAGEAQRLRASGPAARILLPGDIPAWSITRPHIIKELLGDPRISKNPANWPAWREGQISLDWPLAAMVRVRSMLTSDGEDHRRLRKLGGTSFTPRRIEALRPQVEAITADLLHDLENITREKRVDLHAAFASQLPARLICDLFGVPEDQRTEIGRVIDAVLATAATPEQAAVNARDLYTAMDHLITTKRDAPDVDLTTDLINTQDEDGSRLTLAEMVDTLILMLGAGMETAVNLIGHGICELATHPEQLDLVLSGRVSWDEVVEETLRLHPPIAHMPLRFPTEDIHLPGNDSEEPVLLRKGEPIMTGFGAPGRDPALHNEPDTFDITRLDKTHLAFGHGPHYCLGAALGRMEAAIALPALFGRFPHLQLAAPLSELPPQESCIAHGLTAIPAHLSAP